MSTHKFFRKYFIFLLFFVFLLSLASVYSENIDDNVTFHDSENEVVDECY